MKLYILLALTWNFSNSLEYCHIRENGTELYVDCRQDDMEQIHVIRDRSVSCGSEDVLRENINTIRISRCSFNDFDLFKNCTTLHLFYVDEVKSIEKEKLIEMDQLMYITFAYTNLEDLTWAESSFSVLPNLREIECIGYNLTTVSAFQFSNQLKKLRYHVENSSVSSFPVGMFRNLNQLEVLLLDLSEISNFSAIDFTGLENLKQLDFNTNQMSDLIENRSIPKTLRYLSLQNNRLRAIVSISVLPNLIYLDLSLNEIERIVANVFSGLTNLRTLQLSDNSINRIESGAFASLKNLKKLNCGMNKLTALDEHTFKGLHNLRYLNLEDNRISTINVHTFSALTNLVQINLSEQDGLTAIDLNAFPQFINLQTKTVTYNEISAELDDFEMNEREWLKIILSYSNNVDETDSMCANIFQSFWIPDQDLEIDLHNLTQYMRDESLILGNLDLSYNRITSVNIDKLS